MRDDQIEAATAVLRDVLGDTLLALYLHGSAVSGGLRPQSDIDLLGVLDRPLTEDRRRRLLSALLPISARHPAPPGGRRCLEVMLFVAAELAERRVPAEAEFTYGEWLRPAFEAGALPLPARDPENTLVLAQARRAARPLLGPSAAELLPDVSPADIRAAFRAALPALLAGLHGDERNVLLTLARMWRTACTGAFVPKDAAAAWAEPRLPAEEAATLALARRAWLGEAPDDWTRRRDAAGRAAACLHHRVAASLSSR